LKIKDFQHTKFPLKMGNGITQELLQTANSVNRRMLQLLPDIQSASQSQLLHAMHYSAICKGKRIRPFLTIKVAELFSANPQTALDIACALEFIHIYSLIHDDLPAMDDDDFRRGELTCHKKFDEATAILAGDTLLTYSFELLSNQTLKLTPKIKCQLINIISKAIGYQGMAGGQMLDLEAKNQNLSEAQIFQLHHLKTGKMLIAAVEIGAVLGNAKPKHQKALIKYGTAIGLAFQIRDDILDFEEEKIKPRNKPDHASIVNLIGIEAANSQLQTLKTSAIFHLETFDNKADLLRELASFIVEREL
jgi:farnesyl diphosphate synthase